MSSPLQAVSTRPHAPPTASEVRSPVAPAIELLHVSKSYGRTVALNDLSLTVQPAEVFGFLGPNGAGKTTTVKILLGLVRPSAGQVRIFDVPASSPEARRHVGYLPETFRFQDWLTGRELLELHADLADLSRDDRLRRIPEVLRLVGLADRGGDRLRTYSKGMLQRIGLAQAILHEPRLVLLDEPTSALDPIGRREVRDLIRALSATGMTIFLNSHLLSEVELVCDRVAIVDRGRVVQTGRLDELVGGTPELELHLDRVDRELLNILSRFGSPVDADATRVRLAVIDAGVASVIADVLPRAGYRILALAPVQQSLEDVFLSLVHGGDL
ncbi:MAG: ABC transporter ATP-binding protein [Chloroflexi bacterium]|nr:ABC transporter ATP-binding protein [Chloroflexota bacterium]